MYSSTEGSLGRDMENQPGKGHVRQHKRHPGKRYGESGWKGSYTAAQKGRWMRQVNYAEAMEYIQSLGHLGISPGLDSTSQLCRRLGDPQKDLRFVHVAGTNGKGSVSAYIASVLKMGGYRVGRYISPTIFDYRERIQVNDRMISQRAVCEGMERIRSACDDMTAEGYPHPTAFEIETVLGFLYFREKKCDIVVLEAGMGGLLDGTNVVENTCVAVITSISRDHMKFLGGTLAQIAAQKAGIIKNGSVAVTCAGCEEVLKVIAEAAAGKGVPLRIADGEKAGHVRYGLEKQSFDYGDWKGIKIGLGGQYQIENAVLALEALKALEGVGFPVPEEKLREGMAKACWPGRFTVIGRKPYFIVDGAHNEDAARRLAQSVRFYFPGKRIIYIMGVLRDKEYGKMIELTHELADQIITVTPPDNARALSGYELAKEVALVHQEVTAADSLEEAVEMSRLLAGKEDVIVAFGSLSFLGRLMTIVREPREKRAHTGNNVHMPAKKSHTVKSSLSADAAETGVEKTLADHKAE